MKALRPALQDKQFSPAYYLYGDDEYLKEDALRHLIEAAVDPATRDFNLDQRRGSEVDAESLASLVAMPPMMAERRVVVVRDVTALKKDARAALDEYLASPARDVVVFLTAAAGEKVDKTLPGVTVAVDCAPLSPALVTKWIVNRVEKSLGTTIAPAAVALLQGAVGEDLAQLAVELDKLIAYSAGREIDEDAVAAVVGVRREETPGMLFDAIAMRDSARALELLPGVLRQPKTAAVPLVMALTTQMLALAIGRARNIPPARQSGEYFQLLRAGSSNLTSRAWGEATSAWAKAHGKWSAEDLDRALAVLLETDLSLKGSKVSTEEQILATAIFRICDGSSTSIRSNAA
jgi:DNA polymerase III subunit delta